MPLQQQQRRPLRKQRQARPFIKYWFRQYHISDTVKELAKQLNGRILKLEGSTYRKKDGHTLINWGSTAPLFGCTLNQPEAVAKAVSKLRTFEELSRVGIPIPNFTRDKNIAKTWKGKILGRDKDSGRGGEGITVYKKNEKLGNHLFYSSYFKKKREFRIHVFNGKVIFEQEKLKKKGVENVNKYIRSHDKGWCFAFKHLVDEPVPAIVRDIAIRSVNALGLDFGGVDMGWNDDGTCVFEINTAPGLEETSLKAYVEAFQS